jgi:hypothetical protein
MARLDLRRQLTHPRPPKPPPSHVTYPLLDFFLVHNGWHSKYAAYIWQTGRQSATRCEERRHVRVIKRGRIAWSARKSVSICGRMGSGSKMWLAQAVRKVVRRVMGWIEAGRLSLGRLSLSPPWAVLPVVGLPLACCKRRRRNESTGRARRRG